MEAWQVTSIKDTLENSLTLNKNATPPDASSLPEDHVLIEVITAGINPVEYKLPEIPVVGKLMLQPPASPGLDFCGRVRAEHPKKGSSKLFNEGQLVFGALSITKKFAKFGSLGQLLIAPCSNVAVLPAGVAPDDAAAVGNAGLTAFRAVQPDLIKLGTRVFVNGGSGGVGSFTVQFVKARGGHVTTTCSTANVELCRSLGADDVIDYRKVDLLDELKSRGQVFDVAIDNAGVPADLYEQSHYFLKPGGSFLQVAMQTSPVSMLRRNILPASLGGGKRHYQFIKVSINRPDLEQIGSWITDGKVRVVIDEKFAWEDAPKAYAKLRLGRTTGKIVVHVRDV